MWTMRKQFPLNWLSSGRFSAPKRGGVKKWKEWLPKWRDDVELIKLSYFNSESTIQNCLKLLHKRILYKKKAEIQLKRPRGPSFLLEQLERGQVADCGLDKRWTQNARVLQRRPYKRLCWRVFCWKRKEKTYKASSIFLKDMTRNHVENTFSCFDWYFVPCFTLDN